MFFLVFLKKSYKLTVMSKNSIIVLPEGSTLPEEAASDAKVVAFVQEDGSVNLTVNKYGDLLEFENMSKFFKYIGEIQSS